VAEGIVAQREEVGKEGKRGSLATNKAVIGALSIRVGADDFARIVDAREDCPGAGSFAGVRVIDRGEGTIEASDVAMVNTERI